MYAVLVWGTKDQAEFTLSGQLKKYNDSVLLTELFTSLLEPAPGTNSLMMAGAGGTAMVSISTAYSPLIHISVVFNGIFAREDLYDVPIDITLSWDEKKQTILQEVGIRNWLFSSHFMKYSLMLRLEFALIWPFEINTVKLRKFYVS